MAKLWRGERVRRSILAFLSRHMWTLAVPSVGLGVLGSALPDELRIIAFLLAIQTIFYGSVVVMLGALAAAHLVATNRYGAEEIELDRGGLRIGKHSIPRADLATAWSISEGQLEIITHGGDELRVLFQNAEEATELGDEIRAAADRSRSYAITGGTYGREIFRKAMSVFFPFAFAGPFAAVSPWLLPLLPVAGLLGWLGAKGVRQVRFGADGVSVEGRFKSRFVPYRTIDRVEVLNGVFGRKVRIDLTDGTQLIVLHGMKPERAELIRALIAEGVEMVRFGADAGANLLGLERQGDDDDQLHERLRSVAEAGRYRGAAVDPQRLHRLMRNPASPPEQRIAAAIALRTTAGGRAQIRVAAEVSAEPDVRDALEALAEEELSAEREQEILRRLAD